MTDGYQIRDQHALYFVTLTIVDWVDVFTRTVYKNLVIDSLNYCVANKGLKVYGYVIMTNHLHLLVQSEPPFRLSDTLRDFKKFTARGILDAIDREAESRRDWMIHRFQWNAASAERHSLHQIWQTDNHPVEIYSRAFFEQRLNYIHQNPIRAGIVHEPQDYVYSSAYELSGRGTKLPVSEWDVW